MFSSTHTFGKAPKDVIIKKYTRKYTFLSCIAAKFAFRDSAMKENKSEMQLYMIARMKISCSQRNP